MLCWDCCVHDLIFFFWIINRVSKTRFLGGHHLENNATLDVIRILKKCHISHKLSLLDSRC